MRSAFKLHHMGVAVEDFDRAVTFYTGTLGFRTVSAPIEDPIQRVKICFVASATEADCLLELISPLEKVSPVNQYLSKGVGAYHLCYEVVGLEQTLADLRKNGCLIISKPVPAVAFQGRAIAWCFAPTKQLIEIVEAKDARDEDQGDTPQAAQKLNGGCL